MLDYLMSFPNWQLVSGALIIWAVVAVTLVKILDGIWEKK